MALSLYKVLKIAFCFSKDFSEAIAIGAVVATYALWEWLEFVF